MIELATADVDHGGYPLFVELYLAQQELVSAEGRVRRPTQVVIHGPERYTPHQARTLAEHVQQLAALAEPEVG